MMKKLILHFFCAAVYCIPFLQSPSAFCAPPSVTPSTKTVSVDSTGAVVFPTSRQLVQVFADSTARGTTVPTAVGQLGWQVNTASFYRGTGTSAGNWTIVSSGGGGGGSGTVTSVALSMPDVFSVAGSPITEDGTLAVTLATQSANRIWAGPTTGSAAAPAFRALVAADIPDLSAVYQPLDADLTTFAGITPGTGVATALAVNIGSAGAPMLFNGAGGTPSSITLTNGTGLPIAGITGLGTGVGSALAINVGSAGAPVVLNGALGTPSSGVATNLTGTASGLTAGTASAVAVGGITGLGTGVATALAVNVGSAGAPVVFNGALGTPSSGVATNLTGTASGLTAGTASAVAVGGITGLGTGVGTALAVNIGSAGAPVLFNGAGGTPSSITLTNGTGLPIGGITGLGTGVGTALAVNVGSAGAPVVFNGALGTPSSGVATNLTGTASGLTAGTANAVAVGGITGLGTGVGTALAVNIGSAGAPVVFNGAGGTPSSITLTNGSGLPASGVTGTALTAASKTDAIQAAQIITLSSSGTDTYAGTAGVTITSYVSGTHYVFVSNNANTGACSINIDGLGAKTIKKVAGGVTTDLADNDIRSGQVCLLSYDGTNFQIQSTLGNSPVDDTAYDESSWNGVTTHAPSKNAIRDKIESMAGNKGYLQLTHPHLADGTNATIGTTATSITYGHATFSNSADKASNYVEYFIQVPEDLDTSVALRARIKVLLGNTDTGSQRYVLSSVSVADSAVPGSATLANEINIDVAGDGSGASGDVETSAWTTLTSWAGALPAGQTWRIRLARDGDTSDTSTVNSTELGLVIEYGVTQ